MFQAFSKAFGQLTDARFRGVIWTGLGAAAGLFAGLWIGAGYVLGSTEIFSSGWLGWLEWVVDVLGGLATLIFTWLFFPAVASLVMGLLLGRIADAVEAKHYPHLGPAKGAAIGAALLSAVKLLGIMVVLNVVLLVFLIVPPVFPFVFYAANGYLLGREYFELVALRRVDAGHATRLRKEHGGPVFLAGVVVAFLLTVPVVNLVAPVVAVAAMVHMFEGWRSATGPHAAGDSEIN